MTSELITFNHSDAILAQKHWELEMVTENQLREVQMNPPNLLNWGFR